MYSFPIISFLSPLSSRSKWDIDRSRVFFEIRSEKKKKKQGNEIRVPVFEENAMIARKKKRDSNYIKTNIC